MLDQMQNMFENMQSAENQAGKPGRAGAAQADGRTRQADARPAGPARRHLPQRPARTKAAARLKAPRRTTDRRRSPTIAPSRRPTRATTPKTPATTRASTPTGRSSATASRTWPTASLEMQRMLKGLGMKGEKGFDDAEGDMKEAQGDLKGEKGQKGARAATASPARARRSTRRAARSRRCAKALRECSSRCRPRAQGGQRGYQARRMRPGEQHGRRSAWAGSAKATWAATTARSRTWGRSPSGRAGCMEELRRRLADPNRPADERDYLERLMNHN